MGKRIRATRIGRGSMTYRAKSWRRLGEVQLPPLGKTLEGEVLDILHNPGLSTPYAKVRLKDGTTFYLPACEGMKVGQTVNVGPDAPPTPGNILPLSRIPEGTKIYMIESKPGDGGKFVRATGTSAIVVGREGNEVVVQFPSGKVRAFHPDCRAVIGQVGGRGRKEKPFMKAGARYLRMKARGKPYPRVRGVAMNIVDHPFGGGRRKHAGRPKIVRRGAPPGQKVGLIAARRTGTRKG
jgi:large subunit ribosomal protein L2